MKYLLNIHLYLLSPWLYVLFYLLSLISPGLKRRRKLELKENPYDRPNLQAKFCFEVSSEGELEQIKPLLTYLLEQNQVIELIYCSDSVTEKVKNLSRKHPLLIRSRILPLLTYLPWGKQNLKSWMRSPCLILCRYDFFPELLKLGEKKRFVVVSATLKNKEFWVGRQGSLGHKILATIYGQFDLIIPASQGDRQKFEKIGLQDSLDNAYDFRILQIHSRLAGQDTVLSALKESSFFKHLQSFAPEKRLILGSAWSEDLPIIFSEKVQAEVKQGDLCLTIAPHRLDFENRVKMVKLLATMDLEPIVLEESNLGSVSVQDLTGKPVILLMKGILCELYSHFGNAYVGGGFNRSIHSVLEPFVAGCRVFCGPKIHRSTEFDLVKELSKNEMVRINNSGDFTDEFFIATKDPFQRAAWITQMSADFKKIGGLIYEHSNR